VCLGLPESGLVDEPTLELIKMPRCGIKDDLQSLPSLAVSNIRDVQKVHYETNLAGQVFGHEMVDFLNFETFVFFTLPTRKNYVDTYML
jgi:hypothetical protein